MPTYHESYGSSGREPLLFGVPISGEADLQRRSLIADNPEPSDLHSLWEDTATTTDPAIRQRLTALVTAPHEHQLPFSMPCEEASLPVYMQSLPDMSLKGLRNHLSGRPHLAYEMATGLAYWLNLFTARSPYLQDSGESDRCYQRAIYELLPVVSHDRDLADQLFGHYSISYLQRRPFGPGMPYGSDQLPDLSPATSVLRDADMPFEYRCGALNSWEKAITPIHFADSHKRAILTQLTDFMGEWTTDEGFDPTLQAKIARFMESQMPRTRPYCKAEHLSKVAESLLGKDEWLFFLVSVRHLFYEGGQDDPYAFRILTLKDLAFTKRVYDLAREHGDTPLMTRINVLLDEPEASNLMDKLRRTGEGDAAPDEDPLGTVKSLGASPAEPPPPQ